MLPGARDLQVAQRQPLLAEARLLEHADRSYVPRDHRRLHAVERQRSESGIDGLSYRFRRVAAPVVPLRDEVAEMRVLERRRRDPGQLDPTD